MPVDLVRSTVLDALQDALRRARERGQLALSAMPHLSLELPKRPEWGDLATTVAMSLASSERRTPGEVAEIILANMSKREAVFDHVEIAKPGFLNMTVKPTLWLAVLAQIESARASYGWCELGQRRKVLIEFVSANPTGPLHVGHGRGAAVGQALARLLTAAGYEVSQEYYINDAGRQMSLLGASVYARYREHFGQPGALPEDGYRGEYIKDVAARVAERSGEGLLALPPQEAEDRCREAAYMELLDAIRKDLKDFGVEFDSWYSEAAQLASGTVERVLDELRSRDLLAEEEGALWFRSSTFGDDKDRVIRKREGDYTYLAADIAYHRDKLRRGYDLLIDVWGADHHGYIPRMQAAVQAYGYPADRLRVVLIQMVNLLRGGKKVEMSKRAGEFITLREVVNEVGSDAAKFFFLMRRSDTHLDFDLELAKQRSAENPVYYVQYAHARLASLFRVASERGIPVPKSAEADLTLLADADSLGLVRKLSAYPSVLEGSAAALEPHRMTFYLQELSGLLHTYYFKHRILPPISAEDAGEEPAFGAGAAAQCRGHRDTLTPELTAARLVLMAQVRQVLENGLNILGITAPDRM